MSIDDVTNPANVIVPEAAINDNLEVKKNFYSNPYEVNLTQSNLLQFDPVVENDRETKQNFRAQLRVANGNVCTLNLFSFSKFTQAFGISGSQAMRANPNYLNSTIQSIAQSHNIDTCYGVGDTGHVFTRDLEGVAKMADLMDKHERRRFSDVKSTSLTLNRVGFTPNRSDQHYIDAIVTGSIAFNSVKFNTYTEILRQVCSNGMTRAIASSNQKNSFSADWIPYAIDNTNAQVVSMKDSIDIFNEARVTDDSKIFEIINLGSNLPGWVGNTAKKIAEATRKDELDRAEQDKVCPFGLVTVWDYLNIFTFALHAQKDLATKQRLQERLMKYAFRKEFVNSLKEAEVIV
jgi:hypothetical protein